MLGLISGEVPQAGLQHREVDLNDLSGLHEVDGRGDSRCNPLRVGQWFDENPAYSAASSNAPFSSPCPPI
jgi:hypothetical protein